MRLASGSPSPAPEEKPAWLATTCMNAFAFTRVAPQWRVRGQGTSILAERDTGKVMAVDHHCLTASPLPLLAAAGVLGCVPRTTMACRLFGRSGQQPAYLQPLAHRGFAGSAGGAGRQARRFDDTQAEGGEGQWQQAKVCWALGRASRGPRERW